MFSPRGKSLHNATPRRLVQRRYSSPPPALVAKARIFTGWQLLRCARSALRTAPPNFREEVSNLPQPATPNEQHFLPRVYYNIIWLKTLEQEATSRLTSTVCSNQNINAVTASCDGGGCGDDGTMKPWELTRAVYNRTAVNRAIGDRRRGQEGLPQGQHTQTTSATRRQPEIPSVAR